MWPRLVNAEDIHAALILLQTDLASMWPRLVNAEDFLAPYERSLVAVQLQCGRVWLTRKTQFSCTAPCQEFGLQCGRVWLTRKTPGF